MDKKHIYKLIRNYEYMAGEDFTDQHESIVNEKCLLFWMLGRGYITGEKVEAYVHERFTYLGALLCGYENAYSLFPYGECVEDCHFKAIEVLSELISEVPTYQERLTEIVEERGWSSYEKYDAELEEEFNRITHMTIEELNEKHHD